MAVLPYHLQQRVLQAPVRPLVHLPLFLGKKKIFLFFC